MASDERECGSGFQVSGVSECSQKVRRLTRDATPIFRPDVPSHCRNRERRVYRNVNHLAGAEQKKSRGVVK